MDVRTSLHVPALRRGGADLARSSSAASDLCVSGCSMRLDGVPSTADNRQDGPTSLDATLREQSALPTLHTTAGALFKERLGASFMIREAVTASTDVDVPLAAPRGAEVRTREAVSNEADVSNADEASVPSATLAHRKRPRTLPLRSHDASSPADSSDENASAASHTTLSVGGSPRPHTCVHAAHCRSSVEDASSCASHAASRAGSPWIRCDRPGCDRTFTCHRSFARHQREHAQTAEHTCSMPLCGRTFKRAEHLRRHMCAVHGPRAAGVTCPEPGCARVFPTEAQLAKHLASHVAASAESPLRQYPCRSPGCSVVLSTASHRARHERSHAAAPMYPCRMCCQSFNRLDTLQRHEQRHIAAALKRARDAQEAGSGPSDAARGDEDTCTDAFAFGGATTLMSPAACPPASRIIPSVIQELDSPDAGMPEIVHLLHAYTGAAPADGAAGDAFQLLDSSAFGLHHGLGSFLDLPDRDAW